MNEVIYRHLKQVTETAPLHTDVRDEKFYLAIGQTIVAEVDMHEREENGEDFNNK